MEEAPKKNEAPTPELPIPTEQTDLPQAAKSNDINWKVILIESGLIVFSILLALLINEWRSSIRLNNQKEKTMKMIVQELERNKSSLEDVAPYHKSICDKLGSLIRADSFELAFEGMSAMAILQKEVLRSGIGKPSIQSTAWNAAQLSNSINLFDDQILYLFSSIYELQEEGVKVMWKKVAEHLLSVDMLSSEQNQTNLQLMLIYLDELQSQEHYLIEKYEDTLMAI